MITNEERSLCNQIKARNALAHTERLAAIGNRFVGTDGDRQAIDYIEDYFDRLGLEVRETPIEVPGYVEESCQFNLCENGVALDAIPAYFSPGTGPLGMTGELVFLGEGEDKDYEGHDVKDKIVVLLETGLGLSKFWLGTFAARAKRHGAKAIVTIHPMPWPYRMSMEAGNASIENRFLADQVPAVCVSALGGCAIMEAIGRGQAKACVTVVSSRPVQKSLCISGLLKGSETPGERVIVLAHRDNGIAPGANDNGSGTGAMLELARAFSSCRPKRTIEFLSSTAEEGVTQGIWSYIQAHRADVSSIKSVFDLDMFGVGGRLNLVDDGHWPDHKQKHTEWLLRMVEEISDELGYYVGRMTAGWGVAESGRFLDAGVPAVWFWKPDDLYYHSVHDSAEKIDANVQKVVADLVAVAAWRILNQ